MNGNSSFELWKCMLAWWQFFLCGGHQTNFDICTMLNLMSNSLSSWKFMKLHENLVEIHPMWWPPNGFCFPICWVWCQIQVLIEMFCNYMKRWLKYVLFGGHHKGKFVPQHVEFGFKFSFSLKFYAITWKDGWNMSYLVATKWVNLFPSMLSLVSNLTFCWKFMQLHERWLKYVIFGAHQMSFGLLLHIELSLKLKLNFKIN